MATKCNKKATKKDHKAKNAFKDIEAEKSDQEEEEIKLNEIKVKKKFNVNIFEKKKENSKKSFRKSYLSLKSNIDNSPAYTDIEQFSNNVFSEKA